jgi:hypothetical protein
LWRRRWSFAIIFIKIVTINSVRKAMDRCIFLELLLGDGSTLRGNLPDPTLEDNGGSSLLTCSEDATARDNQPGPALDVVGHMNNQQSMTDKHPSHQ